MKQPARRGPARTLGAASPAGAPPHIPLQRPLSDPSPLCARRPRPFRRLALLCCLILATKLSALPVPPSPPRTASPGRALLLRGPEAIKGLPFFSPNAIPALLGEYLVGDQRVVFYYSRETLVLSAAWTPVKRADFPDLGAGLQIFRFSSNPPGPSLLLVRTRRYSLFLLGLPETAAARRFVLALERRFAFFFDNAPSDAELSFPAAVDYQP